MNCRTIHRRINQRETVITDEFFGKQEHLCSVPLALKGRINRYPTKMGSIGSDIYTNDAYRLLSNFCDFRVVSGGIFVWMLFVVYAEPSPVFKEHPAPDVVIGRPFGVCVWANQLDHRCVQGS